MPWKLDLLLNGSVSHIICLHHWCRWSRLHRWHRWGRLRCWRRWGRRRRCHGRCRLRRRRFHCWLHDPSVCTALDTWLATAGQEGLPSGLHDHLAERCNDPKGPHASPVLGF